MGAERSRATTWSALLALALSQPSEAQQSRGSRTVRLKTNGDVLIHEFASIQAVRELLNHRVLVTDPLDIGLALGDFLSGNVHALGRRGRGPGEYESLGGVWALAGDSSLVPDLRSRRWLVLAGTTFVDVVGANAIALTAANGQVNGTDSLGGIISVQRRSRAPGAYLTSRADSLVVIRVSLRNMAVDTVAALREPRTRVNAVQDSISKVKTVRQYIHPLAAGEEAFLFPDGWLAVARVEPYRVDWRRPAGSWIRGPTLPNDHRSLDRRERTAFMERYSNELARPLRAPTELPDWPAELPPFARGGLSSTPEGWLLLRMEPSSSEQFTRYHVVDREGNLVETLVLGSDEKIVGSGNEALYVAQIRPDGLVRLIRHTWVAERSSPRH